MKHFKCWKILLVMASVLIILAGCREADKVNANISKQADYFECERKITVYNAHTDPYHYKLYFHTQLLPHVEIKP